MKDWCEHIKPMQGVNKEEYCDGRYTIPDSWKCCPTCGAERPKEECNMSIKIKTEKDFIEHLLKCGVLNKQDGVCSLIFKVYSGFQFSNDESLLLCVKRWNILMDLIKDQVIKKLNDSKMIENCGKKIKISSLQKEI